MKKLLLIIPTLIGVAFAISVGWEQYLTKDREKPSISAVNKTPPMVNHPSPKTGHEVAPDEPVVKAEIAALPETCGEEYLHWLIEGVQRVCPVSDKMKALFTEYDIEGYRPNTLTDDCREVIAYHPETGEPSARTECV